jgi:superfamily II DNA or RNA helicase
MLKKALSQMSHVFSSVALMKGQDFQARGHVLSVRISDGLLKGRVKGSSNQIYDVYLDLRSWPEKPSRCSCADKSNCEHASACLCAYQISDNQTPQSDKALTNPGVLFSSTSQEEILHADQVEWYSDISEQQHLFFSYQLGILVDGQQVSIVPLVADLIRRLDGMNLDKLPDDNLVKLSIDKHKVLQVELGRIKPLLRLILRYGARYDAESTHVKLSHFQLMFAEEVELAMAASSLRWHGARELQDMVRQLSQFTNLPVIDSPLGLKTELRDYQKTGINWMQCLRENQCGGILADDMGLGKTVQTLAHFQYEKEQGRLKKASLIVVPTTLVGNWLEEATRLTPELKVLIFHGASRHDDNFDLYDLIISTYGLIQRDKTRFLQYQFYYLILDEAQLIKNARAKTTQVIQQLQSNHRLCLSGTPLENHLGELWSLFHFLMPGLLGDAKQFRQYFRLPIEKFADPERREMLARRVQPFLLRRTKAEVAKELPIKTEMTRMITLTGEQRDLYEAIRLSMEKRVREAIAASGIGRSHIVFLDALLKLRQVCCDPRLVSMPEASMAHGHSAKLDVLMELVDALMEEGRSVLVFSQFTSMLALIEQKLNERQYRYLKLTGQTTNRQAVVRDFQEGSASIFLISLKAGGKGLNLTRADTVIHYDPWWNPAVEDQATDRSHRIGQENPVFVYKLIISGSVEEIMQQMQDRKRQLYKSVFIEQEGGGVPVLTEDDIQQFFKPLSLMQS